MQLIYEDLSTGHDNALSKHQTTIYVYDITFVILPMKPKKQQKKKNTQQISFSVSSGERGLHFIGK